MDLTLFSIDNIFANLKKINPAINWAHAKPFPKEQSRCPKLPYDRDARIGVRRKPSNPDKTEKIFGYNAMITTSIEPELGIELPVGCITITGNAAEGNQFIPLQEQIRRFHSPNPRIHLLDAKYDELHKRSLAVNPCPKSLSEAEKRC